MFREYQYNVHTDIGLQLRKNKQKKKKKKKTVNRFVKGNIPFEDMATSATVA